MRGRRIRRVVGLAGGGVLCLSAVVALTPPADATGSQLPTGVTPVKAHAGVVTTGINAHLLKGNSLLFTGSSTDSANVLLYRNGVVYAEMEVPANVAVNFTGLQGSFIVCAVPLDEVGPQPPGPGEAAGCYSATAPAALSAVPFDGTHIPAGATPVASAPTPRPMAPPLVPGSGLAGKVTDPGGAPVAQVRVLALNRLTGQEFETTTATDGTYRLRHLSASTDPTSHVHGYTVCFDPHFNQTQPTTLAAVCWRNVAWNGGNAALPAATKVAPTQNHTTTGISQALPKGGTIVGSVVDAATGAPLLAAVTVFGGLGADVQGAGTDSSGAYRFDGLSPSTNYRVCVDAGAEYVDQCWKNVPWDGHALPSGTTAVPVTSGGITSGIRFALAAAPPPPLSGTLTGRVVDRKTGKPLHGATVTLFENGVASITPTTTDSSGAYSFTGLSTGTDYQVCASAWNAGTTSAAPPGGWAPGCHGGGDWLGAGGPPANAVAVSVTAGQTTSGVTVSLASGAAISGTGAAVNVPHGRPPLPPATVDLFTRAGIPVTSLTANSDGTYEFSGLTPGQYVVCFDARAAGVVPQCYNQVDWDPSLA